MQTDYERAKREGEHTYRRAVLSGRYPYLPALNAMVQDIDRYAIRELGVKEIPMNMIAGTKTVGRQNSFASNFMPLMDWGTEFSHKWSTLYDSAIEEGIREPIKAYEFMNQFYIEEGNKRVSVSKYIGYASVPGEVIRILPPKNGSIASKINYEYIDFYRVTELFEITFSKPGSYARLAEYFGQNLSQVWPDETIETLRFAYSIFEKCYSAKKTRKLSITVGDAFLLYLEVYDVDSLMNDADSVIGHKIQRLWNEFLTKTHEDSIELVRTPDEVGRGSSVQTLMKLNSAYTDKPIRVAFLFEKREAESSWAYGHELGANQMVEKFEGAVEAIKFENCADKKELQTALQACVADEEDIVFATSPSMLDECLKTAIENPKLRIMNCAVNLSISSIPTYYTRMYEAKFLLGCLAASLAENHMIGYRADYPIYGGIANINAFALGAAWFDPYAKIKLVWATKKGSNWEQELIDSGCRIISGIDMIKPMDPTRKYGLYRLCDAGTKRSDGSVRTEQEVENLAASVNQWGVYYEQLLRKLIDGSLDARKNGAKGKAINYWWGMSAGVVDIILSDDLPYASRKAVQTLRRLIITGTTNPFEGEIHTQNGILQGPDSPALTDREIITMDWLCDNVIGSIPETWELDDSIQNTVKVSGVKEK